MHFLFDERMPESGWLTSWAIEAVNVVRVVTALDAEAEP
jgi:hypothetical protein